MAFEDLTGKKYEKLTVLAYHGLHLTPGGTVRHLWKCRCDCGAIKIVQGVNLKNGSTKSCGCWKLSKVVEHNTKHGGVHDRLYGIWKSMKRRCNSPKDSHYELYGGRGIKVCDEWNNYENFKEWAYSNGYDETAKFGNCTIDRIDNNGDYSPENCRWVDRITQANNTSRNRYVEFEGQRLTIAEFARVMNIDKNHAWYYVNKFDKEIENGTINLASGGDRCVKNVL